MQFYLLIYPCWSAYCKRLHDSYHAPDSNLSIKKQEYNEEANKDEFTLLSAPTHFPPRREVAVME